MKLSPKAAALRALLAYATGTDALPTYEAPGPRHPHGREVAPYWRIILESAVPRRDLLKTARVLEAAGVYGLDLDEPEQTTSLISRAWAGTEERRTDTSERAYEVWLTLHAARIPDPWMPVAIAAHGGWHRLDEELIDAMRH
ncbi:hypothetical protein F8O06_04770 [Pseudoclavibacter sp. CFCC 14310]|uniref:hypothetical protein n=1 Tax=Pseudoclavibacter sp. CFCC 14310 TaxID=2615180 RepID=UPI00130105CB|nr:hypothetical protein [Pseudoclavibacter sp. CFCC 14310]KAB1645461.1 hypothetical protein F8O06_07675 [Pseudoclavibacter sp. CFCC 14310]KAB1646080.1 hypothetical protein F8O06_04770 [Pseudoclavibacter sp. CFCC 14310]